MFFSVYFYKFSIIQNIHVFQHEGNDDFILQKGWKVFRFSPYIPHMEPYLNFADFSPGDVFFYWGKIEVELV